MDETCNVQQFSTPMTHRQPATDYAQVEMSQQFALCLERGYLAPDEQRDACSAHDVTTMGVLRVASCRLDRTLLPGRVQSHG